jgi:hypothetical protein
MTAGSANRSGFMGATGGLRAVWHIPLRLENREINAGRGSVQFRRADGSRQTADGEKKNTRQPFGMIRLSPVYRLLPMIQELP